MIQGYTPPRATRKIVVCNGNVNDLDSGAHPFVCIGENQYGDDVFQCPECGAQTCD